MKFLIPVATALVLTATAASADERARLADKLGLNAADYSLNELVTIASYSGTEQRRIKAAMNARKAAENDKMNEAMSSFVTRSAVSPVVSPQ